MVHLAFFLVFGCFLAAVSHAQYHPYYYDWQHMPYPVNRPQYHYNDDHFQAYPSYEGRTPAAMGGSRIWDIFTTTITLSLSTATVSSTVTTTTTCTTVPSSAATVCSPSARRRRQGSALSQLFYKEDDDGIFLSSTQMDESPETAVEPIPKPKEHIKTAQTIMVQPGFNGAITSGQGRYAVAWGTFTTTETVTSTVTSKLTAICLSTTNYQTCDSLG